MMRRDSIHWRGLRYGLLLIALACSAAPAAAADLRWQEGAGSAVAILPPPQKAAGIVGGSLSCAEQRWTLMLRTEPEHVPAGITARTRLVAGDDTAEIDAAEVSGTLRLAVPTAFIASLKTASRLGVAVGDKGAVAKALFSLVGSRAVLEAIAPRCSPLDMTGFAPVPLLANAPSVTTAASLMKDEDRTFRAATGKTPVYASAMLPLDGGRRLMFASLCGVKTAYYGPSGCTMRGYAADAPDTPWREVYATEGMTIYTDRKTDRDGWPGLVTVPAGATEALHWTWTGAGYVASDPQGVPLQSAAGQNGTPGD